MVSIRDGKCMARMPEVATEPSLSAGMPLPTALLGSIVRMRAVKREQLSCAHVHQTSCPARMYAMEPGRTAGHGTRAHKRFTFSTQCRKG